MISIEKLSIETFTGRKLIEDISFVLNNGDKLAIIGEEGNGKSTLLKAIYDRKLIESYARVSGNVNLNGAKVGYLEQKLNRDWYQFGVIDYFLKDSPFDEPDFERYNEINRYERVLKGFGFNTQHLYDDGVQIGDLSGGEMVKLQLSKLMAESYDMLLLDEPTNDLDIETLVILEKFINNCEVPVVYISHDEMLLERTANRILHIEQLVKKSKPKFTLEKCSYDEYVDSRSRMIEHQTQIAYNERREKAKKEEILRQIKQKVENALVAAKKDPSSGRIIAKKMANVKALEKRYEDEELTEIPEVEESINMIANSSIEMPRRKKVIDIDGLNLKIGDKVLSNDISLKVYGPERIAITGPNGCGKTTLIKTILPILNDTPGIKAGYFSQNYFEVLNYDNIAMDEMQTACKTMNPRTLLGSIKLTRDEMLKKVGDLSEGQKAKIALLKLVVSDYNVLVLDEPTRNLSPLSNPVIRKMLKTYKGAIINVSHDRKYISEICDKAYKLTQNGLINVSTNFSSGEIYNREENEQ